MQLIRSAPTRSPPSPSRARDGGVVVVVAGHGAPPGRPHRRDGRVRAHRHRVGVPGTDRRATVAPRRSARPAAMRSHRPGPAAPGRHGRRRHAPDRRRRADARWQFPSIGGRPGPVRRGSCRRRSIHAVIVDGDGRVHHIARVAALHTGLSCSAMDTRARPLTCSSRAVPPGPVHGIDDAAAVPRRLAAGQTETSARTGRRGSLVGCGGAIVPARDRRPDDDAAVVAVHADVPAVGARGVVLAAALPGGADRQRVRGDGPARHGRRRAAPAARVARAHGDAGGAHAKYVVGQSPPSSASP